MANYQIHAARCLSSAFESHIRHEKHTLGVTVLMSVPTSLYKRHEDATFAQLLPSHLALILSHCTDMTTSALDLSDIIDVSQLSSEPENSSPDLHANSLGGQAALRPLLIWRALRSQNGPSVSVSDAHDGRKVRRIVSY